MKYYLIILFVVILSLGSMAQYYPVYSQYMFNELSINPACAGNRDVLSIAGSIRNQWVGFEGAPRTQYLSAHMPVAKKRIGIGIQLINDKIGVTKNTAVQLHYSYNFPIKKGKLYIGLSGAYQFISSNWNKIDSYLPNDIVFQENYNYSVPNIGAGAYYSHPKYYFGLSCPYLLKYSEEQFVKNNVNTNHLNIIFTSGYLIKINKHFSLKPSFLIKYYPDYDTQTDINCNLIYNNIIWTGLSVRTGDALVWLFEYQLISHLRIGYAHDFTFSGLSSYTKGSNEFFLRYEFGNKTNASDIKFLD